MSSYEAETQRSGLLISRNRGEGLNAGPLLVRRFPTSIGQRCIDSETGVSTYVQFRTAYYVWQFLRYERHQTSKVSRSNV